MNAPMADRAKSRPAGTAFVLITVLLDTLGLGLIIPVAPRLVASFLGNDLSEASHYFGIMVSLYAAMQFLFAPVVGGLSDRFGRRPVILVSLLGAAGSYLLSGFAPALWWLFVGRVIAGITGASFSAAGAYIADITPPEKRAASFGLVGAVFGLGFILGPALGGLLGDVGLRIPYFAAAGLNFVNMMYGLFVLPESLAPENRRPFSFARANPLGSLRALARHPIVIGLTGTIFCSFMGQWILQSVWALHTQSRFGWSLRMVGVSLMVVGLATAVVQGGLVRVAIPRLGERRALVIGFMMAITGHLLLGLATQGWMILVFIAPLALGGLAGPAVQAIISGAVGPKEQGELQGSLNSLGGIAAIIGPVIGTSLLARFGPPDASPHIPGAAFFAAAAFNLLGLLLALRLFSRAPRKPLAPVVPG
ncbi:MAG: TCR/Tet family MFS transporter [Polyangiaceae bacterium]|jgi:DHA1 family tetracycline resistance protein-like MFS transporter